MKIAVIACGKGGITDKVKLLIRLSHFVLFDLLWFSTVWGRENWTGLSLLLVVMLYASAWRYLWARRNAVVLLAGCGLLAELLMVTSGIIRFSGSSLLPAWLILLWLGFVAMALVVFTLFQRRYLLSGLAGMIMGPLTYLTGIGLGAAQASIDLWLLAIIYGAFWAVLMVLIVWLIEKSAAQEQRYV